MLTFTLIFRTLMEHKAFLSTWCKTFLHTREKEDFFLNTLKISLTPTPREGPFQVMFVRAQHSKEHKKLNTRKLNSQDATQITPSPAESCIQCLWPAMPMLMTTLTWMVRNIPNRYTIQDFTEEIDEARFVRQYNSNHLLIKLLSVCVWLL